MQDFLSKFKFLIAGAFIFVLGSCAFADNGKTDLKPGLTITKIKKIKPLNTIDYKKHAKGKFRLGPEYTRKGNSFVPKVDTSYSEVGYASWYGPGFHGRKTSNGAVFNQNAFTAAHRTLPLPSVIKVTNLENNRAVIVVVDDRGPFNNIDHAEKPRIIDLSKKAAATLGMMKKGVAKVHIEFLPEETKKLISHLPRSEIKKATLHYKNAAKNRMLASIF